MSEDLRAEIAKRDEELKGLDLQGYEAWVKDFARMIRPEDLSDREHLAAKIHTFTASALVELSGALAELWRTSQSENDKTLASGLADLAVLVSKQKS